MMSKEKLGYFFDPFMWDYCYTVYQKLLDDDDHFTVFCGTEGVGKSTFAAQVCAVISPSFRKSQMCFEPVQLVDEMDEVIKKKELGLPYAGESLQLDEGGLFLFSREAMSKDNVTVLKLIQLMRQLSIHVCICIPNFFSLDSYIREHRVDTIIHLRSKGGLHYYGYTSDAISTINEKGRSVGKKIEKVIVPEGTSWGAGYWNDQFPSINDLNKESYTEVKFDNLKRTMIKARSLIDNEKGVSDYMSVKEFTNIYPLSADTVINMIKSNKLQGTKVGAKWFIRRDNVKKVAKTPPVRGFKGDSGSDIYNKELKTNKNES